MTLDPPALAAMALERPLAELLRGAPVAVAPATPLQQALQLMQSRRVGSVLVLDAAGRGLGILTRHDLLDRVALARPAPDTPVDALMSSPLLTLDHLDSAQAAALTMSRHGIRHVPVTRDGRVIGLVSERDLFALQQLSPHSLGGAIRAAADLPALVAVAADLRRFTQRLLAQGVAARALTALASDLNDQLTRRLVALRAAARGLDLRRACWLAFGSEGRSEQTIVTDQDNGLVFAAAAGAVDGERAAWLAFGREVNEALDACGFPLCAGQVMAGNPACCLTADEWAARFDGWLEHGAPQDLLNASIFFDFRPLAGDAALAQPLRERLTRRAQALPRFLKQLADNALRNRAPLNWRGALDPTADGARRWIDLKLHGSTLFVDAARLFALAHGVAATNTRERLQAAAPALHAEAEAASWISAFELVQTFRLRVQGAAVAGAPANHVDLRTLNPLDLRILREALRTARALQQRIAMDYPG